MSYPIPILNELHDQYPDILYNPSRFQSGEDIINYIIEQGVHRPYEREFLRYQTERTQREQHDQFEQRVQQVQQESQQQLRAQDVRNASLSQRELIQELEREMYGAVVSTATIPIPISQTSSVEQLLSSLIDNGLFNARPSRPNSLRPTTEHLSRSTTIHSLTENAEDLCYICHDGMLAGQSVRRIHHCNHMFHQLCIDTWFSTRPTCPTCRHDVRT